MGERTILASGAIGYSECDGTLLLLRRSIVHDQGVCLDMSRLMTGQRCAIRGVRRRFAAYIEDREVRRNNRNPDQPVPDRQEKNREANVVGYDATTYGGRHGGGCSFTGKPVCGERRDD